MKSVLLTLLSLFGFVPQAKSQPPEHQLSPPRARDWVVLTDRTERAESRSNSQGSVTDLPQGGVSLDGRVGTVLGGSGPVGFVIFRTAFTPANGALGVGLKIYSQRALRIDLVIKNKDRNDTFQVQRNLEPGLNLLSASWDQFRLFFRGREVPSEQRLSAMEIEDFAIQVRRGGQNPDLRNDPQDIVFQLQVL